MQAENNIPAEKISIEEAFTLIGTEYGVHFNYDRAVVSDVVVNYESGQYEKVEDALQSIFSQTHLKYEIFDQRYVAVYRQDREGVESMKKMVSHFQEMISSSEEAYRRSERRITPSLASLSIKDIYSKRIVFSVSGIVTDQEGEPLIGVNIQIKGSDKGTATDFDGKFSLEDISENAVLVISYVGYQTQEVAVEGSSNLEIVMMSDAELLDEVVVVGYGTMKKSDLTGAVSSIKTKDIQKTPITSIDQGLVGRAAGVLVTQTSGMPGAVASIRVRGSSSIQGGNEPLYVIDGVPIYSGSGYGNTGGKTQISGLATINPSDIESIEILKDASATAIYGARAANGVVLITTKSGKSGDGVISFESKYGVQQISNRIDVMGAQDYANLVNEAFINDGLRPYYSDQEITNIENVGNGTDWQDLIFRNGSIQDYSLSFSGGSDRTTYAASGSFYNQKGTIINSHFKRYSARINLNSNIKDSFTVGGHVSISHTNSNSVPTDVGGEGGVVNGALKMNPILQVFENKEIGEYTQINVPGILIPNPVGTAKERDLVNINSRVLGNLFFDWGINDNLHFRSSFGVDLVDFKSKSYTPLKIFQARGISSADINISNTINWINENTISWSNIIEEHKYDILGGFTLQQNLMEGLGASSSGFVNDVLRFNALESASIYNSPSSSSTEWSLMSFLGRINYSLRDRYLLSISTRIDGSSRFGKNNKYGLFPSFSAGWRLSEEDFIKSKLPIISDLKVRASFGYTGNTEIGLYESLPTLGSVDWVIGNQLVTGFFPNKIANPDLKWEKTSQVDIGLDLGVYNNRLRFVVDYYNKKTSDLLYSVSIPSTSGYQNMLQNIGSVENRGIEIGIESVNIDNRISWNTNFNISFNKNRVLDLGGETYKEVGGDDGHLKTGDFRRLIVGEPIGVFYGYIFDGIFQSEEEVAEVTSQPSPIGIGYRRYKDLNGDGKVDASNDRTIIGDSNPLFHGGIANTIGYKNLELNLFIQFSYGGDIFNYNAIELETPTGGNNVYQDLLNRWTPDNPSLIYPKASTNRAVLVSDRWIEDGSYIKFKSLSISYSFPKFINERVSDLSVYFTANNLYTITNYRGYDPEVSYQGASTLGAGEDFGGYPQSKSFLIGFRLNI